MTTGQQILEQGRQKGREEGRQEGRREGECAALLLLLRQRFGNEVDADVERRIAMAPLGQIEIWVDRLLSAATLTELLAD